MLEIFENLQESATKLASAFAVHRDGGRCCDDARKRENVRHSLHNENADRVPDTAASKWTT